jgi:hypothetical protein
LYSLTLAEGSYTIDFSELKIQTDRQGGFAELFSVPLANIPTNTVSTDPEGNEALGFFNISAVRCMGGWFAPENLPGSQK